MAVMRRIRAVLSVGLLAAAGACAGPATVDSPTATPSPRAIASPMPTATPTPGSTEAPAIQKGTLAEMLVDGLDPRTEPSSSAPIITTDGPPVLLEVGDTVLVLSDAKPADGQWWFKVGIGERGGSYRASVVVGWIAGGTKGGPSIRRATSACREPSFSGLLEMNDVERLKCLGSDSITFRAHQASVIEGAGLGGACDPGDAPGWLVCDHINYNVVNSDGGTDWQFLLHFDPAAGITPTGLADPGTTGPPLMITGHFNDQASEDCIIEPDPTSDEATAQKLSCAAKFVVERLQGTD